MEKMEKQTRKHLSIAIAVSSVVFLSTLASFFAFGIPAVSAGSSWMGQLPDDRSLSRLSIPGSHDSGATLSVADLSGKCQDSSIGEQLNFGVRFFDVRLKNYRDSLYVYHGFINENQTFSHVLSQMTAFLGAHPTEGILLSAKKEQSDSEASESFEQVLQKEIAKAPNLWLIGRDLPANLGAIRGKITLISRYPGNSIGLDAYGDEAWKSDVDGTSIFTVSHLRVQDHYQLSDNAAKWSDLTTLLSEASADTSDSLLYLNFFSGYLTQGFPPTYSLSTAKFINPRVLNHELPSLHPGVLICDFVTAELTKVLWEGNA